MPSCASAMLMRRDILGGAFLGRGFIDVAFVAVDACDLGVAHANKPSAEIGELQAKQGELPPHAAQIVGVALRKSAMNL